MYFGNNWSVHSISFYSLYSTYVNSLRKALFICMMSGNMSVCLLCNIKQCGSQLLTTVPRNVNINYKAMHASVSIITSNIVGKMFNCTSHNITVCTVHVWMLRTWKWLVLGAGLHRRVLWVQRAKWKSTYTQPQREERFPSVWQVALYY